jgi:hypothetical protein
MMPFSMCCSEYIKVSKNILLKEMVYSEAWEVEAEKRVE